MAFYVPSVCSFTPSPLALGKRTQRVHKTPYTPHDASTIYIFVSKDFYSQPISAFSVKLIKTFVVSLAASLYCFYLNIVINFRFLSL